MRLRLARLVSAVVVVLLATTALANTPVEIWYPSADTFATWVFEDQWPSRGDYDLNDLVVLYRLHYSGDEDGIRTLDVVARVEARGASRHSGLGLRVAVPSAAVASAGLSRNCALQSALAPEAGQTYATFLLFSDLTGVLPSGTSCQFANTEDDCGVTTAQEYILTLTLTSPVTDLNTQAVDPFVFRTDDRGVEVHLPGLAPTDLATPALFGTRDDATAITAGVPSGHYYLTANHLPWALDVATEWRWPLEETSLLSVYPDFAAWAQSGGGSNPGWYLAGAANVVSSLRYAATIPVDGACVCPPHSHVTGGVCVCDDGYSLDGLGACVYANLCEGVVCLVEDACTAWSECNPLSGQCVSAPLDVAPLSPQSVTATSVYDGRYVPSKLTNCIVTGGYAAGWLTADIGNRYPVDVVMAFGCSYAIDRVVLFQTDKIYYTTKDYLVQVSSDGVNYTTVATNQLPQINHFAQTNTFQPTLAQYVRIRITSGYRPAGYDAAGLSELQVFPAESPAACQ